MPIVANVKGRIVYHCFIIFQSFVTSELEDASKCNAINFDPYTAFVNGTVGYHAGCSKAALVLTVT